MVHYGFSPPPPQFFFFSPLCASAPEATRRNVKNEPWHASSAAERQKRRRITSVNECWCRRRTSLDATSQKTLTQKQQKRDFSQKIPSRLELRVSEGSKGLHREKQHATVLLVADGRKKKGKMGIVFKVIASRSLSKKKFKSRAKSLKIRAWQRHSASILSSVPELCKSFPTAVCVALMPL